MPALPCRDLRLCQSCPVASSGQSPLSPTTANSTKGSYDVHEVKPSYFKHHDNCTIVNLPEKLLASLRVPHTQEKPCFRTSERRCGELSFQLQFVLGDLLVGRVQSEHLPTYVGFSDIRCPDIISDGGSSGWI